MSFQLVPARQLPSIDLSKTLLTAAVSAKANASITRWIRRHALKLAWCNRIGSVGIIVGFFAPKVVGEPVMTVCAAVCLIGMVPGGLLLNVPLLLLLLRQYDFWIFSLFNAANWSICTVLFGDLRAFGCLACWLNTMLIICVDANTRTLTTLVRGATLWLPGAAVVTIACVFHLFDIDSRHYKPLRLAQHEVEDEGDYHRLSVTLVNLFANASITISICVGLRCYFKREVLSSRFRQRRMIPSSIFRIGLALEACSVPLSSKQCEAEALIPISTASSVRRMTAPTSSARRQSLQRISTSVWQSVRVFAELVDPAWHQPSTQVPRTPAPVSISLDIQQMQLIRSRGTTFSSDDTLIRGLNGPDSSFVRFVVALSGSVGLLLSVYGQTPHIHAGKAAIVGLALSVVFAITLLARCNRRILLSLVKSFDVVFVSFQACTSTASIWVSMQVDDARVFSIVSLLLWLHLTLVVDALLPDARHCLRLKKRYLAPSMLCAVVANLLLLHSILTGSSTIVPVLVNRAIVCFGGDEYCIYTLSFLLNRLVSLLIVLLRLLWVLVVQSDNDLIFLRGRVEFYAPPHRLPFEFADTVAPSTPNTAHIPSRTKHQVND